MPHKLPGFGASVFTLPPVTSKISWDFSITPLHFIFQKNQNLISCYVGMWLHYPVQIKKKSSVMLLFTASVIYMKLLLLNKGWKQHQPSTCHRAKQGMCPGQPVLLCHVIFADKQKAQGRAGAAPWAGRTCSSSWLPKHLTKCICS